MTDKKSEKKLKLAVSGIKKEVISTTKKFAKFIKFLKNFGSVSYFNYILNNH